MSVQSDAFEVVDATFSRVLSVWWLFIWRSAVGSIVLGLAIGIVIGGATLLFGVSQEASVPFVMLLSVVIGIVWGMVVLRMALNKNYRGFSIVLVRNADD